MSGRVQCPSIASGRTTRLNVGSSIRPSFRPASRSDVPSWCAVLAILAALS